MRPVGEKPRQARTLGGPLAYRRSVYECPACRSAHAPLDEELGLASGEKLTRRVVRKVAYAAANQSFGEASRTLAELADLGVSAAECARVAQQEGARIEQAQRQREAGHLRPVSPEQPAEPAEIASQRLVMEADAACVLTVAGEEHKSVYCATAFALEDRLRKEGSQQRPVLLQRRYAASAQNMEDFGPRLKALGYRMGMRGAQSTAFIADGAVCLWKWAGENLPADTVLIQDFWHVMEHLAGLVGELYGSGAEAKALLEQWRGALRASRLDEILDHLRGEHKIRRGAKRKRLGEEIHYLESGRARMDYARFEEAGWPIGSGAAEGTCKHLIKERFCVTGAHWRRSNIAPVLALRQAIFNEEWDGYWSLN
jgi:hypothetical protein